MRVAVDTNVLVRYILRDDSDQALAAEQALEEADRLVISTVVLCELVWVLRRVFSIDRPRIAEVIRLVLSRSSIEVDRSAVSAGLSMLEAGGDFADGCVLFEAGKQRCNRTLTFDKRFAALAGSAVLLLS